MRGKAAAALEDYQKITENHSNQIERHVAKMETQHEERITRMEAQVDSHYNKLENLLEQAYAANDAVLRESALLKIRVHELELLVGLCQNCKKHIKS